MAARQRTVLSQAEPVTTKARCPSTSNSNAREDNNQGLITTHHPARAHSGTIFSTPKATMRPSTGRTVPFFLVLMALGAFPLSWRDDLLRTRTG